MKRRKSSSKILLIGITLILVLLVVWLTNIGSRAYAEPLRGTSYNKVLDAQVAATAKMMKPEPKHKKPKKQIPKKPRWEILGTCRITEYCRGCNDPAGSYQSSSGVTLYSGCAACSWLPIGTKIRIHGYVYTIVDICGTNAIDLFTDTAYCQCDRNEYTEVEIYAN